MYEILFVVFSAGICALLLFMIDRNKKQTQKLAQLSVLIENLETKYSEICDAALALNEEVEYLKNKHIL